METAVAMNDLAIIVDLLGILTLKPYVKALSIQWFESNDINEAIFFIARYIFVHRAMWNLDLCNCLLGPISDLLQSKYEM